MDTIPYLKSITCVALPAFYIVMVLFILLSFGAYIFWSLRTRAEYVRQQCQAESQNRVLVQRFDYLSKFANDIIILGDDRNHFLEINDRAIEAYGYTRAEFLKMGIRELRAPEACATQEQDWHNLAADGQTLLETIHRRKDGTSFPVEISARMISADRRKYMQAIIRDISERKQAEVTLRLHEQMTNCMQEGLSLIRSDNGVIVFANPKFNAMFGYAAGEIHGNHINCLNAPTDDDPEEIAHKMMEVLHQTGMWSGEVKNIRKDGTVFWCNATVSSFIHHDYGKVWLTIHQDITERKQLEQAQVEHLARIRELGQRLLAMQEDERRKLGMELHDCTAANLAAMNLLLKDLAGKLPAPAADILVHPMEDFQALMMDTISSIREISANLHPPLLDLFGLDAALNNLACQFSRRIGIPARVRSTATLHRHEAVATTIYRIAQEALTNCAKHAYANTIDIDLADADDQIVLTIADDGVGFSPEALGWSRNTTSLGLLTMRERTEFSGGSFYLASAPGLGTTIRVEIPSARVPRKSDV
ncbi:Oxygen sensor histidine kinase NreB (modular protein) [Gammaproteobacteria bacterium]